MWPSLRFPNGNIMHNCHTVSQAGIDLDPIHRPCSYSPVYMHLGVCMCLCAILSCVDSCDPTARMQNNFLAGTLVPPFCSHSHPYFMSLRGMGNW